MTAGTKEIGRLQALPREKLFYDLEGCALIVARSGAGKERPDRLNRLAVPANDPADIALPQLNLKDRGLPVRHLRKHHFVRKFDQLTDNKLEKFFHRPKNSSSAAVVDDDGDPQPAEELPGLRKETATAATFVAAVTNQRKLESVSILEAVNRAAVH